MPRRPKYEPRGVVIGRTGWMLPFLATDPKNPKAGFSLFRLREDGVERVFTIADGRSLFGRGSGVKPVRIYRRK